MIVHPPMLHSKSNQNAVSWFGIVLTMTVLLSDTLPIYADNASWIWADNSDPAPKNRFTYFRKVVELDTIPHNATLHFAADSNARLWINGHLVRRKVTRYHEQRITAEVIEAAPYLHAGKNTVVVFHHNWGDIITFQRTGNQHAGLYLRSSWVVSDAGWKWKTAPEFLAHNKQIVGLNQHARIRYPQIIDGRRALEGDIHNPDFSDADWLPAHVVDDGPWPNAPADVETPGQREYPCAPLSIIAAGKADAGAPISDDPFSMAQRIKSATFVPDTTFAQFATHLTHHRPLTIDGSAGESYFITMDFGRPLHGYPYLSLQEASAGVVFDFGYCEIYQRLYDGSVHVQANGWIDPESVVGAGYGDRYISRTGSQTIEIPDERTARWLCLLITFPTDGRVIIDEMGMVKSQYAIEPAGSFECGREEIEQIRKLCLIHSEVTMSDVYVDTPGREDGQWIEDDRPRALLSQHWYGDTRLRKVLIRTHAEGQGEDGNLHPFSPSNFPAYPSPYDWSVQWVACLYDEYLWTGDPEIIRKYWENLARYWNEVLSHVDEKGLWRTNRLFGDIRIGLHPENNRQSSGLVTPWIIERLRWSAEMASAIRDHQQAKEWSAIADRMAEAFRTYHVIPAGKGMPLHVGDRVDPENPSLERGYSQAGQTVAILSGLLTKEEGYADLDYAFPAPDGSPPEGVTRWNNPTYGYRALKAIVACGLAERAVAHLIERYSPYLPGNPRNTTPLLFQGPFGGPLPEYWVSRHDLQLAPGEINHAQPSDETGSHGWGALPLLWFHDSLLGVKIIEPGGGSIRIAPTAGGLPYIAGHTLTPKGLVYIYFDPRQWRLEITIPADLTAEVVMPPEWKDKHVVMIVSDNRITTIEREPILLRKSGRYIFVVR